MPLLPRDEAAISAAVRATAGLESRYRRLSAVRQSLPKDSPNSLYHRLGRWCRGGPLGWVFDEAPDVLAGIEKLPAVGFDYTEFVNDAQIRTPLMMYLWARFSSLIDGRRLYMFIDEFWKALEDEYFESELQNRYKTIRKQNWFLVCATQSPADAIRSRIAHTVIEQTATFIYLPNPQARETDYTEGFNVTRQEYLTIKSLPETSRRFLVKQGQNAVVCELDLQGFDDELAVLSGTTANILLAEDIRRRVGTDPAVWLPVFHQERKAA
jgi:type IV secretion system protein VirB4